MVNFPVNITNKGAFKAFVDYVDAYTLEKVDFESNTAYFKTKEGRNLAVEDFLHNLKMDLKSKQIEEFINRVREEDL